jgi:serine/threonine protein kinase/WD40 repeat protein/tetratricopeptide (TPR) repeat protein
MNPPPNREVVIFNAAVELPASQRGAYLQEACADDPALRLHIEALLHVHEEAGAFLETPAPGAQTSPMRADVPGTTIRTAFAPSEKAGDRIGRYKLLQQIGEGGCGVVYMAEQEEPVRRRVALKVIKLGMDTRQVIARFEAERQALALMDHPNIAKVLDAGATETGRPYFVMELVKGVPITRYCDENNLSTATRLGLFVQVCQAIQHAHQKGIIHRDIKPSNVLVADHDGVPVPKIIDFGIAKATTDQRLTDKTLFTAFEQFIGTPAYMSPEQAKLSGLDIDTRSDIYSLGVLLYELLTGKTPFEAKRLLDAGLDEIRRIIREEEPVRPSTRLHTLDAAEQTTVAKHRQSDPPKLVHLLSGDLDWIVMKALEKDRGRRYETANGLAMDVQRHLRNEPVVARPPSAAYRLEKAFRRNKLAFIATSAVAAALIVGLGLSTWLFIKEKAARQQAVAAELKQGRLLADARKARRGEAQAREGAEQSLYGSLVDQAHSTRVARRVGYRERVFNLLQQANGLRVPQKDVAVLSREAVACLGDFVGLTPTTFTNFPSEFWLTRLGPTGRLAAFALMDGSILLRQLPSGTELPRLRSEYPARFLCFNASGDRLMSVHWPWIDPNSHWINVSWLGGYAQSASLTNAQVEVWARSSDGQWQESEKIALPGAVACLSCAKGDFVVSLDPPLGKLINLNTRAVVSEFEILPDAVTASAALSLSMDGRLFATGATGGRDQKAGVVNVWDLTTGEKLKTIETGLGWNQEALNFSPDGKFLACQTDLGVAIFSTDGFQKVTEFREYFVLPTFPAFAPDRPVIGLPIAQQHRIKLWDWVRNEEVAILDDPGTPMEVAFTSDGSYLLAAGKDHARLYSFEAKSEALRLRRHASAVTGMAFSPDGTRLASVGKDNTVKVSDASTGVVAWESDTLPGPGQAIAYSPDGKWLATGDYKTPSVWLWDARTGKKLLELQSDGPGFTWSVAFTSDGRHLATAGGRGVSLWAIELASAGSLEPPVRATLVKSFPGSTWSLLSAPDGKQLAFVDRTAGGHGQLNVWEVSGAAAPRLLGYDVCGVVEMENFVPDGRQLVFVDSDRNVVTLDVESGKKMASFPTIPRNERQKWNQDMMCSLSPDGAKLALSSPSSLGVDIWDPKTGQLLYPLPEASGTVYWLAWSPDSRRLSVARSNGDMTIWNLDEMGRILADLGLRQEAVQNHEPVEPIQDADKLRLRVRFGVTMMQRGDLNKAETAIRGALALQRKLFTNDAPDVADSLNDLGFLFWQNGRLGEAETNYVEALALVRRLSNSEPSLEGSKLGVILHHLAGVLGGENRLPEARSLAEEAVSLYQLHADWPPVEQQHAFRVLEAVLTDMGDQVGLEARYREQLQGMRDRLPADDLELAGMIAQLGYHLLAQGKFTEAEALARESLSIREKRSPDDWRTFNSRSLLGSSLLGQKKYADAEPFLLSGYEGMKQREDKIPDPGKGRVKEALQRIVELYEAIGQPDQASEWRKKLSDFDQATILPERAESLARQGRWKEAASDAAKAVELSPEDGDRYHTLAPLLVASGDAAGYRELCQRIIERFAGATEAEVADRMAKDCLILPSSGADLAVVGQLADRAVSVGTSHPYYGYFQCTKGLAEYRLGKFGSALEWARKSLENQAPGDEDRYFEASMVQAMAHYQLKQLDQARAMLGKGIEIEQTHSPKLDSGDLGGSWRDWLIGRALKREAQELIDGRAGKTR